MMYKLVMIFLIVIILIYKLNEILTQNYHIYKIPITENTKNHILSIHSKDTLISGKRNTFKILLWTKYFQSNEWKDLDLKQLKCRYSNCILTEDRNSLRTSDSVLFHWRDINTKDLPEYHMKDQKWVLYYWESPDNSDLSKIKPLANHINWTMTYRHDSDIFVPYGRIYNCSKKWKSKSQFPQKRKSIAWIASNCQTSSKRELYIKQLQSYIDVDIYGDCGQLECSRDGSCYDMIAQNYKFYLSFENSLCKDYVTEKLFRIIEYDIIPIVFGSANYKQIMPFNSYIDVFNFSTPKSLANYLKRVGSDENIYNSYFEWKYHYCSELLNYTYFCDLCQKLNNPSENKPRNRTDLIDWWFTRANCIHDISIFIQS